MIPESSTFESVHDVPFVVLADLYKSLRSAKVFTGKRKHPFSRGKPGNDRKTILTTAWLKLAEKTGRDAGQLAKAHINKSFVPSQVFSPDESFTLLSLLVPSLDSSHAYLGMKETKFADAFIRALDLVPQSDDAQWLKHFKEKEYRPQKWKQDADIVDGNLATVLKAVLHDRCPKESSLTIGMVWQALDLLGQASRGRTGRIGRLQMRRPNALTLNAQELNSRTDSRREAEDKRNSALRLLITNGTADEVSEVARIILKDLDVRLSEDLFFHWFHPSAKQHYIQVHDIHKLLADCFDPTFEIGEASVQVGQYASVMLTMRPSRKRLNAICESLRGAGESKGLSGLDASTTSSKSNYFIMEPKLDGERLQLHKWKCKPDSGTSGDYEIRTFSRRGNDSSAMYASALTDVIMSGVKAEDIILDGEIMIWDELKASWVRFEDVREVSTAIAKREVPDGSAYVLKYMVFDVLYVDQRTNKADARKKDGSMVIRLPLFKRRALLERLVQTCELPCGPGVKSHIEVVKKEDGHNEKELIQTLQRFEALGYEGVIAKSPDMPYVLAERSLDISIKLKPDYFDGGIQDLDVLILGAKYSGSSGHRKQRAGRLSSFLIGVRASEVHTSQWRARHDELNERMKQCKWIPVGSVGTGYSDKDLSVLQNELTGRWKDFSPSDLPEHFERREYAPNMLSDVAKWIQPWQSIVLTIRAYEVNRRFYALRFPRVERVNWDKPYFDVPTFTQLLDLDENKLPAVVRPDEEDVDDVPGLPQKRKRTEIDIEEENALKQVMEEGHLITGGRSSRKVIDTAAGVDISSIPPISNALANLTFMIIASDVRSKEELEIKVHELGGRITQNLTSSVDYVICTSAQQAKVRALREALSTPLNTVKNYSIVLRSWVDVCHEKREHVLPMLECVIHASRSLESKLFKTADRFGDPWMEDATVESMRASMEKVEKWKNETGETGLDVRPAAQFDIMERVDKALNQSGIIYSNMVFYVPRTSVQMIGSTAVLEVLGAEKAENESNKVTHVLVHSSLATEWRQKVRRGATLITEKWVQENVKAGV